MKSAVENSFPFNPGNTRQWAPGSPSPSLLEHQCPIHPPETPPPLCHMPLLKNQQWLFTEHHIKHLEMSQDPPSLAVSSTFQHEFSIPALLVFSPQPHLHYAPSSLCAWLLDLLTWNILSAPSWLPTTPTVPAQDMSSCISFWYWLPSLYFQCLDIRNRAINTCWPDNFEYICSTGQQSASKKGFGLTFCLNMWKARINTSSF